MAEEGTPPEAGADAVAPLAEAEAPAAGAAEARGDGDGDAGACVQEAPPQPQPARKAHAAVSRAVSLAFLAAFVAKHRGTARSWSVAREFLAEADGGGGDLEVVVTRETLARHRAGKRSAELARSGKPVAVRYVEIPFERLYTTDVVESFVRAIARLKHCSFAEAEIRASSIGSPDYFASHAWERLFVELAEGLIGDLEGAALDDTFVWLDIFAINQDDTGGSFSAMEELDGGRTLARVIELSRATKVVLDKQDVYALTRLWCLYEIGATPSHKLHLVTRGFDERDIAQHLQNIDAETALCFSADDRTMIHAEIVVRFGFGSMKRFTEELRLRFLLRPLSYAADITALRHRSSEEVFQFDALRDHIQAAAGPQSGRLACVVGDAGEGKSTLSAALLGPFGGDLVHAAHFCKRTDAARQDPLAIIQSLAYQLSARFEEIRACILSIEPAKAQEAQVDASVALEALLLEPLRKLAASERSAVVLIDALDEADGKAINHVVGLLRNIRKANTGALSLIVTMRPVPEEHLAVLNYEWGAAQTRCFAPADLRCATAARAEQVPRATDPRWAAALQLHDKSKIYRVLTLELLRRSGGDTVAVATPAPPPDVDAAYRCFFDGHEGDEQVQLLLGTVMSAFEPLSSAHLDELGLLSTCERLPGWGLLFEERDHLLQTIHLSLREFLLDVKRSSAYAADVLSGHTTLARSCLKILLERTSGPTLAYALRYGHVHLAEVLASGGAESTAVTHEWFQGFLEPRKSGSSAGGFDEHAARNDETTVEPEPELTAEQVHGGDELIQSYKSSLWQAREVVATWLERQAQHGRSKLLVPELLALEEQLLGCTQQEHVAEWVRVLWQLVQHLRWGIGTFWAPNYDSAPDTARAMFAGNLCRNSPLYLSAAASRLGPHRMRLPARIAISPTIHQLLGHSDCVMSAQFSPDGLKIVSASGDQTGVANVCD